MKNGCLILKRSDMMKSPENGKENEQMKVEDIISHVDHTLLKAAASWEEIRKLCDEAVKYHTASVCVPSSYVKKRKKRFMLLMTAPMKLIWSST